MAYGALPVKAAGDLFTVSDYNIIKGNCEASAPGIVAAKGDIVGTTGVNAIARLAIGADDSMLVVDSGEATGLAWQITPAVRLSNTINIDPAPGGWVALTFDTETHDADELHSLVANTGRITIPANADGIYLIGGNVELDTSGYSAGSQVYGIRIRLNGTTILASDYMNRNQAGAGLDISFPIATEYPLAVADYVELLVYVGWDVDVQATVAYSPVFWAVWQRRS